MAVDVGYAQDVAEILSHQGDQGGELWTTPDKRLLKGAPFSALEAPSFLRELGMEPAEPVLQRVAGLFFDAWREDGRFKVYPTGGILPYQTAHAADLLCRLGYAGDERIQTTYRHFLSTQHTDGGWRCEKFYFGKGPETACSNPFPSLVVLSAFRFSEYLNREPALNRTVEFLLDHWTVRKPIGPCHYGMGRRFMQVEYPFRGYNLFLYVYILSFYHRAREDRRFLEALAALEAKLEEGQVVVERVVPKLAKLAFCKKGAPSALATARYREILKNLGRV